MHEAMCQIWMVDVHNYIKGIYFKKKKIIWNQFTSHSMT
jgi:hypothetical protein